MESLMIPERNLGAEKYLMTILSGTKLVTFSVPAGQRPWTVADSLVRDSKCSLTPFFCHVVVLLVISEYLLINRFYRDSFDQTDTFIIQVAVQIIGLGQDVISYQ